MTVKTTVKSAIFAGGLVSATALLTGASPAHAQSLVLLAGISTGVFDDGASEIVSFDPLSARAFVTNSGGDDIDPSVSIYDLSDPATPTLFGSIDITPFGAGPNSVSVKNGVVAVAVEANVTQDPGSVVFFDTDGVFQNSVTVGALPDMLTFTPDGSKVLVANEGEANGTDPEGSISIIDISGGVGSPTVQTAGFTAFNGQQNALAADGVRLFPDVFSGATTVAQELEPEYIAVSEDGTTAFVSLQEANTVAVVDIAAATVTDLLPLGLKDHSQPGQGLDASDDDTGINIANWPVFGMPMPDSIGSFTTPGGETYFVTANEGDARDEDDRVDDLTLDSTAFPNAPDLQRRENLGRLEVSTIDGDLDGDGDFDQLQSYGTRSFSIYDAAGNRVFDSGDDFEQIIADQFPADFNSNNDENGSFDARSDAKGPEPEALVLGTLGDQVLAFIGLERMGGIMIYDVTDPNSPEFLQYINNRDFSLTEDELEAGLSLHLGPEGFFFVPGSDSPNDRPLLLVANEISGSLTIYAVQSVPVPAALALGLLGFAGLGLAARRR